MSDWSDIFTVAPPRRRVYTARCDDCGRRRALQTVSVDEGVSADLCRECRKELP